MWSHGYVPADVDEGESVSKSLEYSLAFGAAQQAASALGLKEDSAALQTGAQGYRKLFDADLNYMLPHQKDGSPKPMPDFNPCHQTADYTEGTPWQYAWLVPHDVQGLIGLYPTQQAFITRLDSLFLASAELNADANPDITGLIGQYAHGNEPGHHIPYLYNYVGQPWKTARLVRQIMSTLYTDKPDGLCGNEDVGQMSAWYILSALGLYQVEPAADRLQIGTPSVTRAELNVGEGRTFTIVSRNLTPRNIYVQQVKLNGRPWHEPYILYKDIIAGGTLEFVMGAKSGKMW
ncbi:MAG: glycoside hydrolase family 92 protein [Bacteroidaceae bacterium]|nr:glycoside hydrolase family 92 protein [Bacteroidaceae bacterium]